MTVRLLPDVEALVVDHLRAHASVSALVGTRVSTKLPPNPTLPAVTVRTFGGVELVATHLDEQYVQIHAWHTSEVAALTLARTVRAALIEARTTSHARGVVTDVRTVLLPQSDPDEA